MKRSSVTTILAITFLILIFQNCNPGKKSSELIKAQKVAINKMFSSNESLFYEFYNDSIIKNVYAISGGNILSFYPSGGIKNISFINKDGKKVGDETNFNLDGNITGHLFWLDENNLLFHLTFKNNKIESVDGKPWFIHGSNKVKLNDTASFYIATPLIPDYTTNVSVGLIEDSSKTVNYINDIRQMKYKLVMKEIGVRNLKLVVKIEDIHQNIVVHDSTQVSIEVR